MEKFQLSILFKIIGIGSASGLLYQNNLLYIISDNSTYLYEYNISNEKLGKIPLVENPQENIPKKDKPDFEAITNIDELLVIIGSGSTQNRNKAFAYDIPTKKRLNKDYTKIYSQIKTQLGLKNDELNIEGIVTKGKDIYFFQRGNGIAGKNGIIYAKDTSTNQVFNYVPFDLPKINNVSTTFTDAILVDNKIYFLASAEDTASTYEDGEVLGSIIGTIDLQTMKLENTIQISDKHKFEGLTLYDKTAATVEFLLCEDTDSDVMETTIYKLAISFKQ